LKQVSTKTKRRPLFIWTRLQTYY